MHPQQIQSLTADFESYSQTTEGGVEFWLARDLQELLEYTEWRNFLQVIEKAKVSAKTAENNASDHFVDVNKKVCLPPSRAVVLGRRRKVARKTHAATVHHGPLYVHIGGAGGLVTGEGKQPFPQGGYFGRDVHDCSPSSVAPTSK